MGHRDKLVPMVVAMPLFLQTVDTTIMGTAVPTIAQALRVDALNLNLAITAYLLSLAIFLPASGWVADRFGPRRVLCWAVALFSLGSGLCGLANSLEMLVACRVLQGAGGAMMVPVGRLILLRTIAPSAMVAALVWYTVIPTVGRLIGPALGGMIVTWASWRWIFFLAVPLGAAGIVLALVLLDADGAAPPPTPFDGIGFLLLGVGLAGVLGGLEGMLSPAGTGAVATALVALGVVCLCAYGLHCRACPAPLIDFRILRERIFFAAVVGGIPVRLATGALPFLMPLLFQFGFGLSPLESGLLTMGTAIGSLASQAVIRRALKRARFRTLLVAATVNASLCYLLYALLGAGTPQFLIFIALWTGGLMFSLVLALLQALAFSETPQPLMGQATALSAMVQQLAFSVGVLVAAELLRLAVWSRGGQPPQLQAQDFVPAFVGFAVIVVTAVFFYLRLPSGVGDEFRKN